MFNLEKTLSFQYGSIIGYIYIILTIFLFRWGGLAHLFNINSWVNAWEFLIVFCVLGLLCFGCSIFFVIFLIIDYKCYNHIKNIKTTKNSFYRAIQYIGFFIYVLISLPIYISSIFTPPYIGLVGIIVFLIIFLCFPNKKREINQLEEENINDEI